MASYPSTVLIHRYSSWFSTQRTAVVTFVVMASLSLGQDGSESNETSYPSVYPATPPVHSPFPSYNVPNALSPHLIISVQLFSY